MDEIIYDIIGMKGYMPPNKVQIGQGEEGYKLYIEREDGEGIAIPVDQETFESIEKTFMLSET